MRVCILSMQRVPNFGSLLQGYSLKKMIESLGHEVEFIDIEENPEENTLLSQYRKNFSSEYGKKKLTNRVFCKFDKYFINRIRTKRRNRNQMKIMEKFQKEIINLDDDNNHKMYDYCVIGSDEVFNALNTTEWGFTSQLFGNVSQANKVITYAASCGFTTVEDLPESAKKVIFRAFKNISFFSVRDENTRHFVQELSDKQTVANFDPVVVGNFSDEAKLELPIKNLPKKYCIVYAYHNRINNQEEIRAIKNLCKKEGIKIISVGASQAWIGKHLILTPFQIPEVFSKAEFVITDTFHGTIFAAKYATRFAILVRASNEKKLGDLIDKLSISEHRVRSMSELNMIYHKKHDLDAMHELEKRERVNSLEYLKTALREE